ncbi:MAG: hypothetical protein ACPG77_00800 [Nannocystaceae bacterium]
MHIQRLICLCTSMLLAGACGGDNSSSTDPTSEGDSADSSTTVTETDPSSATETETSPTTEEPTTEAPTTEEPTTDGPTTEAPTTEEPTTEEPTTDDPTGGQEVLPPTNSEELLAWLQNGEYEWWPSDSIHDSDGPHFGQVQTFFNPALHDSFEAANPAHPVGAATVKRLLGDGDATGWSVAVKTQDDSDGGNGWYWFEFYEGSVYGDGNGVGLCTNCHSGGNDYVLTPFPLL